MPFARGVCPPKETCIGAYWLESRSFYGNGQSFVGRNWAARGNVLGEFGIGHACKNDWTDRSSIWDDKWGEPPKNEVIRWTWHWRHLTNSVKRLWAAATIPPINQSKFIFWAITVTKITILHENAQKAAREAIRSLNWPPKQTIIGLHVNTNK